MKKKILLILLFTVIIPGAVCFGKEGGFILSEYSLNLNNHLGLTFEIGGASNHRTVMGGHTSLGGFDIYGLCFFGEIGRGGYDIGFGYVMKTGIVAVPGWTAGFSVRVAHLGTWSSPIRGEPGQRYYGIEVRAAWGAVLKLGYYVNIEDTDDTLVGLSIGVGL
jgi:hypothetical protein